jgi:glycosyltransferase involved in cell wall biosynthesis
VSNAPTPPPASPRPRLSVIIPAFNAARYLGPALASVLAQTGADDEIIVVDDGSTDATAVVAARFGPPVTTLRQARAGPSAARNHGLARAQGALIGLLDADDRWPPDSLPQRVAYLRDHPEVEIVQGLIQDLRPVPAAASAGRCWMPVAPPYHGVSLCSALFRRAVFQRVGPLDARLDNSEDTDWLIRAWEHGVVKAVLPLVSLYYRRQDNSLSQRSTLPNYGLTRLMKLHLDRTRATPPRPGGPPGGRPNLAEYLGFRQPSSRDS